MPRRPSGFTLVECLIVGSIMSLLAAWAAPSVRDLLHASQLRAAANGLVTEMALTRSLAVSRSANTVMCPSLDGATCSGNSDWSRGWITFVDRDRDLVPDSMADIVSVEQQVQPEWLQIRSNAGRRQLRYLPSGFSSGTNLTVQLCDAGKLRYRIVVNNAGRVRTETVKGGVACSPEP